MKNLFLPALVLLALSVAPTALAQSKLFTPLSIQVASLNPQQRAIYEKVKKQNAYLSINFVETAVKAISDDSGRVVVESLAFIPSERIEFTADHVDFTDYKDFSWHGKFFTDDNDTLNPETGESLPAA